LPMKCFSISAVTSRSTEFDDLCSAIQKVNPKTKDNCDSRRILPFIIFILDSSLPAPAVTGSLHDILAPFGREMGAGTRTVLRLLPAQHSWPPQWGIARPGLTGLRQLAILSGIRCSAHPQPCSLPNTCYPSAVNGYRQPVPPQYLPQALRRRQDSQVGRPWRRSCGLGQRPQTLAVLQNYPASARIDPRGTFPYPATATSYSAHRDTHPPSAGRGLHTWAQVDKGTGPAPEGNYPASAWSSRTSSARMRSVCAASRS
jgi:hypothetical protein